MQWKSAIRSMHLPLSCELGLQAVLQACAIWRGQQGLQQRNTHLRKVLYHLHVGHVETHRGRLADHRSGQIKEHRAEHILLQKLGGGGGGEQSMS